MKNFISNKTLIIGLGLLGGSIAKAFKSNNISKEIWAFDVDIDSIESAKKDKIIEGIFLLEDNLSEFDIVVLCTPLSQYQNVFLKTKNSLNPKAIFFDIGSIKDFDFKNIPQNFIPCHPIAGSDKTGYKNSDAKLFAEKNFIICKKNSDDSNTKTLVEIIEKLQAKPIFLEAKTHDKIYGLVSHLPQFLSFLCAEFSPKNLPNDFLKNAFRLDKSSPEIWEDIFALNQKNLEFFYDKFYSNLENLIENLPTFNPKKILKDCDFVDLSCANDLFDDDFLQYLEQNFASIFFRFLVAISLVQIPEIKTHKNYAGKGFSDFISILKLININDKKLNDLVALNKAKIVKIFDNISN